MRGLEDRILNATMRVFMKEGYEGATTRKIAQEARVNEVTLFRKFKSKENLLRAVIMRNRDIIVKTLYSIIVSHKDEDLRTFLRSFGRAWAESMEGGIDLILIGIAQARRDRKVADAISSIPMVIADRIAEYFEEEIRKGRVRKINPRAAAFALISHLYYGALVRGATGDKVLGSRERTLDEFIDIFMKGIGEDGRD